MSAIAFLLLLFGFMAQLILGPYPHSSAVFGIVCGIVAVLCGVAAISDGSNRAFEGTLFAFFGVALTVWCIILLPSTREAEERMKEPRKKRIEQPGRTTNERGGVDAGRPLRFACGRSGPGAAHRDYWAA
jgi:hypothetical protein